MAPASHRETATPRNTLPNPISDRQHFAVLETTCACCAASYLVGIDGSVCPEMQYPQPDPFRFLWSQTRFAQPLSAERRGATFIPCVVTLHVNSSVPPLPMSETKDVAADAGRLKATMAAALSKPTAVAGLKGNLMARTDTSYPFQLFE